MMSLRLLACAGVVASAPNIVVFLTDDQDVMLGGAFPTLGDATPMPRTRELLVARGAAHRAPAPQPQDDGRDALADAPGRGARAQLHVCRAHEGGRRLPHGPVRKVPQRDARGRAARELGR